MPINYKEKKSKTLATIDAALTILDKFPKLDNTNTSLSINTSANPFQFITDLFKTTAGYDMLIEILSGFIYGFTPYLEYSVKTILIANMKNLLSCSLDFRISEDILKNGIAFDAKTIDLMNILRFSPLEVHKPFAPLYQKLGRYYYFDIENVVVPDDLLKSKDFNAYLWYIINKANKREVWNKNGKRDPLKKDKKKDGTVTLEYHERSSSMLDSEGVNRVKTQSPIYNCVHVFLGNAEPINIDDETLTVSINNLTKYSNNINDLNISNDELSNKNSKLLDDKIKIENEFKEGSISEEQYNDRTDNINKAYKSNNNSIKKNQDEILKFQKEIIKLRGIIKNFDYKYNDYKKNYYYNRTIIEFNYDYIMSLQIFDSKTLTAQLLDAVTGCLSIDLNLSYEQLLVKFETKKIIESIVNTDYADVSNCFFTFSNDEYNNMLEKAEKYRNGVLSFNGEENSAVKIDADDILKGLNSINKNTTQEEVKTIIKDTITNLSKELSKVDYKQTDDINFGVRLNIIENLLNELSFVLVSNVLSPKIYLLLAINLKLMENKTEFDLRGFMEMFKQFIVNIIREVRDLILKYLVDELMKIVGTLAKDIAIKLTIEQADYYYKLINRLIDCFKRRKTLLDFNIDNVDYADILPSEESEPENNEC